MIVDNLSRDVLRALHFPQEGDDSFKPPTVSGISTSLNVSFSAVASKLREMRETGLIPKKLSMAINGAYIKRTEYLLLGLVDRRGASEVEEAMRTDPPRYVLTFHRANMGTPNTAIVLVFELLAEETELEARARELERSFPSLRLLPGRAQRLEFPTIEPSDSYEKRVVRNLSVAGSFERRVLRALWEDTDSTVPELTDKVGGKSYRTVKRVLDAMVRVRAFWLFPEIDSAAMQDGSMFAITVQLEGSSRDGTIMLLKELLRDDYVMYRDYYADTVPFGCVYRSRREYESILNRLNSSGLHFVVFDDFRGFSTKNCPLD
ncbi:hypothetical protein [Sulfodiicoccus acidiphilus]|uniref:hypothetical protein n=1 Tax=Sulfodiicoccus acidiphilus TaxID=1670455 RepID=UPI000F82AA97|nr:hypothetical protein [Sulfodiicoccus acidiphilus]